MGFREWLREKYSTNNEALAMDAKGRTSLAEHDKRFHKNGYKKGQRCLYRKALERGDSVDMLRTAEIQEGQDTEEREDKALVRKYRREGAIHDVDKCKKARDMYMAGDDPNSEWGKASRHWRIGFNTAAKLASGLRLFSGGTYSAHPVGDPEPEGNLAAYINDLCPAKGGRHEDPPKRYGPDAVKYAFNYLKDGKSDWYYGKEYPKDILKGMRRAAEIFGIDLGGDKQ